MKPSWAMCLAALLIAPVCADELSVPEAGRIEIPHLPSPPAKERLLKWVIRNLTRPIGRKTLFVTIPYITLDPNSGWSEGLMPVWIIQGDRQNVAHIVAPSVTYNNVFQLTGTLRHYFYPRTKTSVVTILSRSQRTNGQATVQFEDHTLVNGRLFLLAGGGRIIDGANRFFGFGPNTRKSDESAFSIKETRLTAGAGWDLTHYLQAAIFQRYRDVNIDPGTDPDILDTLDRYPALFGLSSTIVSATIASLSYDIRDSPTTPTQGMFGQVFTEQAGSDVFNADTEFQRYGAQCRFYLPHGGAPHVAAFRAAFDIVYGRRLPFYEQAQVGGFDTLRGFPEGRFIDRGRLLVNAEERFSLAAFPILGVTTHFEIGPFVGAGTVFPRWQTVQPQELKFAAGGFLRAVVRPTVVGTLELGFGKEGPVGFVDIGYPF